ncbi:Thioredoxin [Haladaptatus litoreus]|uniref:Thioredoxin n=1 Tax=Haladaptatus litoreus TaxID=553468 RepID=A0A1N7DCL0_9EURY|nr:thioredoxin domain-containing protein [Haladaptatus litoreus]SIR73589.1 Thioredoxin [Haladaptatus litoreus]
MNRRTLLTKTVPIGLLLAGCTSQSDESNNTSTTRNSSTTTAQITTSDRTSVTETTRTQTTNSETEEPTSTPETTTPTQSTTTETTTPRSTPDHPSTSGIFDEPTRGPTPFSADATLIIFDDPSCPNCLHFEQKTYPKLKRNYVDAGKLSLVYRSYPVLEEWGVRATYALEATYGRDEKSFWDLKEFYFDNQDSFTTNNVFSKTEQYINKNTSISGQAVVRDAQSKAQKAQIQEDLSIGGKADVRGTPTFFAFRSDEYVTDIVGRQSYSIFKNVLGL